MKRGRSTRFFLWLIRAFINKYPYIHRLQSIYIDKQTHNVFIDVDIPAQKLMSNTFFWTRWFDKLWVSIFGMFKVSSKNIEEIHAIVVETRHQNFCLYKCNNSEGDFPTYLEVNRLYHHDQDRNNMIAPYLE